MKKQLDKNFDSVKRENEIYKRWLKNNYFGAEVDKTKKPYTIILPPPNITGQLHMGHALDSTIQDMLIRTKRMQGYNALWIPGTDHASISTELKIVNKLLEEGITKEELGREKFLERAWEWKKEYGGEIVNQLKQLGNSCDWAKERFTMDDNSTKTVMKVFLDLHKKGYIYRSEKIINWCPSCKTTISDAEVDHKECEGSIWHMQYKIKDTDELVTFATTRPETILGDTALAVNPNDDRYSHLIGKTVIVPIVNREIPIVADDYVEIDFGTGVVKITPAHDPNDFEVGQRHNLPIINIMNDNGTLNEKTLEYCGLNKLEARKKIVNEFQVLGLFVKEEKINHSVGTHERCDEVIEPLVKMQWFVKMSEMAKPAIKVLKDEQLNFIPSRSGKIYLHWLENIKDWCISRQLWWGHRIPAYYCQKCGNVKISENMPSSCNHCCGTDFIQDEDTLDTWFSSALWPFSTLNWLENSEEFNYFYPNNVLVTGYDIIFFWVVRMVFSGIENTGNIPFNDVVVHGLIRDEQGRKMSKSLGNGINPLEIINEYGADVLRLTLIMGNSLNNDIRFSNNKIISNRNFLNKIWNATKFLMIYIDDVPDEIDFNNLTNTDKWILSGVNSLARQVTLNIDNYDLGTSVKNTYDFIWNEYCDWYIEMVKPRLYNEEDETRFMAIYTLREVLIKSMKLLHPCMPFITEEIFTIVQEKEETIMTSSWVEFEEIYNFEREELAINQIKLAIKSIRNMKAEMEVKSSKKINLTIVSNSEEVINIFENNKDMFVYLANIETFEILNERHSKTDNEIAIIIKDAIIYIPLDELIDKEKELKRLKNEEEKLIFEIDRINKKLSNKSFVDKAPKNIIEEEKEKLNKYQNMIDEVRKQLNIM